MAITDPILEQKVNELKQRLPTVDVDGKRFYVAEGDLMLEEAQLPEYVPRAANVQPPNVPTGAGGQGLVGIVENGKLVRWPPGFVLSYCVLRPTFDDEQYAIVRDSMIAATRDWETTCGVQFRYEPSRNGARARPDDVVFAVRGNDGGRFIAMAFFPNEPASQRNVLLNPSYFDPDLGYSKVGILRHELGHVLGFRHEHIRSGASPDCPKEGLQGTIDLTRFDPRSVMHYFCGGVGSREMQITGIDVEGAQKVYGPPLAGFQLAA